MKIGSLFSGAGGLDMAVEHVFGGEVIWQSEVDKAASTVLAHRFPGVPNLSDITQVNWNAVESPDVICGGFPCQDVSVAGKQAGLADGTRSGLWAEMARIIGLHSPSFVVIENVRGLLSATANRNLEPGQATMGDGPDRPVLRALGAVLGDLADLGYDAQWATVAAGDVGAPHRRERVFVLATHSQLAGQLMTQGKDDVTGTPPTSWPASPSLSSDELTVLPTPTAQAARHGSNSRFGGGNGDESNLWQIMHLLPTPTAEIAKHSSEGADRGVKDDANLWVVARRLPTPTSRDHKGRNQRNDESCLPGALMDWGKYEPAIRRWEALTRPAPPPTEPSKNGNPRLSAAFSQWLMGWPDGWVTDPAIGISRNDQLRIIGNGVCPQQATAALTWLLQIAEVAA